MKAHTITRTSTCALVALGLLAGAGAASAETSAAASGIVIGLPGAHGVELVGADHQAHKVTTRHRSKRIRPGAVVHYKLRKHPKLPVRFQKRIGHVTTTYVLGVASGATIRLADGTRLTGKPIKSGVSAMKAGSAVKVTLHFDRGHTQVRGVTVYAGNTGNGNKNKNKGKGTTTPTPAPPTTGTGTSTGTIGAWWQPTSAVPLTLHWVLDDPLNLSDPVQMGEVSMSGQPLPAPDVYDIDGFENSAATVAALHAMGKKVICYVDAGVYETYRPDAAAFQALKPQIWGAADEGWAGSYWLDIRRISELAPIMQARFQMCKDKGFDAIEPDEITGWSNNSGFPLTYADQIAYNRALAGWAHAIGMSIGLKGDIEQAHDLVGNFDWTLNEQCYEYNECTDVSNEGPGADGKDWPGVQLFSQAGKAVWIAEYKSYSASQWASICADSQANHFNTALYKEGLPNNGGRTPCAESW